MAATRAILLTEARSIFATSGYEAASTEEIVKRAKVTRGALYHHFRDKRALFEAVVEEIAREIADSIDEMAEPAPDPLREAAKAFSTVLRADVIHGLPSEAALKRLGQPEDVARIVGFLAGPSGAWVTGQQIDASGGAKL